MDRIRMLIARGLATRGLSKTHGPKKLPVNPSSSLANRGEPAGTNSWATVPQNSKPRRHGTKYTNGESENPRARRNNPKPPFKQTSKPAGFRDPASRLRTSKQRGRRYEQQSEREAEHENEFVLPHEDTTFLKQLGQRHGSTVPELQALREYTLANRNNLDLTKLSTLYAAAGMLKYASTTLNRAFKSSLRDTSGPIGSLPSSTSSSSLPSAVSPTTATPVTRSSPDWMELLEAGRRQRSPEFVTEMMTVMQSREGRYPSKKMKMVLLNTYAECAMTESALNIYREMADRHGADVSMKMALLKATIRQRNAAEAFVDEVVELVQRDLPEGRSLPRRVSSLVLMAYASRTTNTVDKCLKLSDSLSPLRPRDLLALLRACREAEDIEQGDRILQMIVGNDEHPIEPDVSLSTEIIRFQFMAGRIHNAISTYGSIPWHTRDLALVNVVLDALCDVEEEALARNIFLESWERGFWRLRQRKVSRNRAVAHVDLHRMGCAAAGLAIDQHLKELKEQENPVKVVKLLVGKSQVQGNPTKLRLAEHVRQVLYERGIRYKEEDGSVFTFSL